MFESFFCAILLQILFYIYAMGRLANKAAVPCNVSLYSNGPSVVEGRKERKGFIGKLQYIARSPRRFVSGAEEVVGVVHCTFGPLVQHNKQDLCNEND
jgi:hypothetical protein